MRLEPLITGIWTTFGGTKTLDVEETVKVFQSNSPILWLTKFIQEGYCFPGPHMPVPLEQAPSSLPCSCWVHCKAERTFISSHHPPTVAHSHPLASGPLCNAGHFVTGPHSVQLTSSSCSPSRSPFLPWVGRPFGFLSCFHGHF